MTWTTLSAEQVAIPTGTWRPVRRTGHIGFEVKTLWGLATVRGQFGDYDGTLRINRDHASAELKIESASLDTGNSIRDRHLRSADFFDADKYPSLSFRSTAITMMPGGLLVAGDLTIGGTAVSLELPVGVVQTNSGSVLLRTRATVSRDVANLGWNRIGMIRGNALLTLELELVPEPEWLPDDL